MNPLLAETLPRMISRMLNNPNFLNMADAYIMGNNQELNISDILRELTHPEQVNVLTPEQEITRSQLSEELKILQTPEFLNNALNLAQNIVQQAVSQQMNQGLSARESVLNFLSQNPLADNEGVSMETRSHLDRIYIVENDFKDNLCQYECSICLTTHSGTLVEKVDENVIPFIKLKCNHIYDEDCILTWLSQRKTCPICRAVVE
jgi:RING-H2 zinc finger domain